MSGSRAISLTLSLGVLLGGCVPDLSAWQVVGRAGSDAGAPAPPLDGQAPPGPSCAPPVTCAEGCALPWLLASVEDLGDSCGGRVWRWSLGEGEEVCACEALDAEGRLPRLPFSVGFVPPEMVVVAAEMSRVVAIDGRSDRIVWEESYGPQPVDVFAIEDHSGRSMVGVAGRPRGGDIRSVDFYDAAVGGAPIQRTVNGDLPIGLGIASITQSPFDPRWMRVLKNGSSPYAAADVDPWTNELFSSPYHTVSRDGFFLGTLHASYDGRFHRTVWTGVRSDLADRPSGVYRIARVEDPGDNRVPLSERCTEHPDGGDYDVECDYLHAVADPRLNTASFALCQHAPSQRRIVRLRSFGSCETVVEQGAVYSGARISRLALAQDTLWGP